MKIELIKGCICDSFRINDEPVNEMDLDKLKIIAHNLIDNCDESDLQWFIGDFTEGHGEYKCLVEHCECCGDSVDQWTWNDEDYQPNRK